MSAPQNGDRVTNKQLYEELGHLRNDLRAELADLRDSTWPRREGFAVVGTAIVLGQIAARVNVGSFRLPSVPVTPDQAFALLDAVAFFTRYLV